MDAKPWALGAALLVASWVLGTPPGSGPDEWAHLAKASALARGVWLGAPVSEYGEPGSFSPAQLRYLLQTTREVELPSAQVAPSSCNAFQPERSARCPEPPAPTAPTTRVKTVVAAYPPAASLLPALALRGGAPWPRADWLARAASALLCAALAALGLWQASRAGPFGAAGALGAFTPTAAFLAGVVNASGLEVCAALATAGALARLAADARPAPGAWRTLQAAALLLCVARPLGPAWLALHVAAFALAAAPDALRARAAERSRLEVLAGAVLLGVVLNRAWAAAAPISVPLAWWPQGAALRDAAAAWPGWLKEQVGVVQYLDTPLPRWAYAAWAGAVGVLLLAALRAPGARPRWALLGALAAAALAPVALFTVATGPSGFPLQGRYVLPALVVAPVLAGALAARAALPGALATWLPRGAGATFAAVHFAGAWAAARRSAVGTGGPWWFFPAPEWAPPWGWGLVLALAAAGALALAAGTWRTTRTD